MQSLSSQHENQQLQNRDMEMGRYEARITARLCVIFIALTQAGLRFMAVFAQPGVATTSKIYYLISIPFLILISAIVAIEYALYKKKGSKIAKYSPFVDFLFLLLFTAEWIITLYAALVKVSHKTDPPSYSVTAIFGFTSFGWRTLFQSFITQCWWLKAISPTIAVGLVMGYVVHYDPSQTLYTLIRGILQVLYIIVLFYFEDRIRLRMLLANVQQEKWMKINEFILNNIPENIMIFDRTGETKFINDYCQAFLQKYQCAENIKHFFTIITNLVQQTESGSNNPSDVFLIIYYPLIKID